ncbi:MAG: aldo/keto reductase [Oscillospiraceae bacterium]|nr:aldo/keto reductase [Oscillospiraceae bacterium]
MLYNEFKDRKLSALGLGCMRLPTVDGKDSDIDEAQTAELVRLALRHGINYFDTAYMYHGGNSETVMGKVLKAYPRDSFYLATKFPGFRKEQVADHAAIFEDQLRKCQVEYFDFYLVHCVCESNIDLVTDEELGLRKYLLEQKRLGRIRHLGFSTHGSLETMARFLDNWGDAIEFCQIQLNWLDWKLQNAQAKVELLNSRNIPIWVMEPVRGGRLVNLPQGDLDTLDALRPGVGTPAWAFRFLQTVPGITMVLSGMSNETQLLDNIATFCENKPLNETEWNALMTIADRMIAEKKVPCTGCSYCVKECPMQIPIPDVMTMYNNRFLDDAPEPGSPGPKDCVACGQCKVMCPQTIDIPAIMADYAKYL